MISWKSTAKFFVDLTRIKCSTSLKCLYICESVKDKKKTTTCHMCNYGKGEQNHKKVNNNAHLVNFFNVIELYIFSNFEFIMMNI